MSSSEGVETTDSKENDAPSIEVADEPYIPQASIEEVGVANDDDSKEDNDGDSKEQDSDDSKQDDGDSKEDTASADEQPAEEGMNYLIYVCNLKLQLLQLKGFFL